MKRVCFLLKVKKDRVQEYLEAHEPVWPELLDAMREVGIRNYSMFHRPDGLLVGYLEAEDPARSLRELECMEVSQRWEAGMAPFFEAGSGDLRPGELEWLTPYFHMP